MTFLRLACRAVAPSLALACALAPSAAGAPRMRSPMLLLPLPASSVQYPGVLDVDLDGRMDIVAGTTSGLYLLSRLPNGDYAVTDSSLFGSNTYVIGTGRLNGDAAPDVVVRQISGDHFRYRTLLNAGSGFVPSPNFASSPPIPFSLRWKVADLDGDQLLDIASAVGDSNRVDIYLNDGAGGFGAALSWPSAVSTPGSICAADLDGNGTVDLVLSAGGASGDSAAVYLGLGDGTFAAPLLSQSDEAMTFGDFDASPGLDGIFRRTGATTFRSGTGNGQFGPPVTIDSDLSVEASSGDFDGDGKLDLATIVMPNAAILRVSLGHGDGTFEPGVDHAAVPNSWGLVVADVDSDGRLDATLTTQLARGVSVYLGNGDGTFGSPIVETSIEVRDVALADLDGDANLDAVSVDVVDGLLTTWHGAGDGTFGSPSAIATGGLPSAVATGRVDADAFPDVLVPISGQLRIFRNDGAGNLLPPTAVGIAGSPDNIATGDLDGDGDLDVVLPARTSATATILLGDGVGSFTAAPAIVSAFGNVTRAVIARFDADAFADLALSSNGQVLVYSGLGNGAFAGPQVLALDNASTLEAADADGDGDIDLFALAVNSNFVAWWRNDGTGVFGPRVNLETRPYPLWVSQGIPADLRVRDLDDDGLMDIVVNAAMTFKAVGILPGTAPGVFGPPRILGGGKVNRAVDAGDVDGDGDLDLVVASSGSSTFGSPGVLMTLVNEQDRVGIPAPGRGPARPGVALTVAWPSPARGAFTLRYRLPVTAPARIDVVSINGRRVTGVDQPASTAGEHVARISALERLPAGLYTVIVSQGADRAARKIVLLP